MLGAILVILTLIAAAWYVAKVGTIFTLAFIAAIVFLAYKRLPLIAFTVVFTLLLAAYTFLPQNAPPSGIWKGFLWLMLAALWLFNVRPLRKALISRPFLKAYMRLLPSMSQTEKEALEAGTVWWDGELFTGKPKFEKLLASKAPQLTAEEQAFLDGPCEELCRMYDDWDITHRRADMPPKVWDYLKSKGFFAMIIPKKYGGLEFSAYAHSCVLVKLSSRSRAAGRDHGRAELARPRGIAESLRHRGTEESLPAAPGARRGSAVLRAHRSARRLRRGGAARYRHRVPGPVAGPRNRRAEAELQQALHHARAHCHGGRARVPHVRPRQADRRQAGPRHHLRADSRATPRDSPSAAATFR